MTKRCSKFKRNPKDFYVTPDKAIFPLLEHLDYKMSFIDPCYGTGAIASYLMRENTGSCVGMYELYPEEYDTAQFGTIYKEDAAVHQYPSSGDFFITNPPWDRNLLHPIIENLAGQKPTWLLFDADWMHTKQAEPYLKYCVKIVSVGRVSWMGNGVNGMDNCCWYLFDKNHTGNTILIGRKH